MSPHYCPLRHRGVIGFNSASGGLNPERPEGQTVVDVDGRGNSPGRSPVVDALDFKVKKVNFEKITRNILDLKKNGLISLIRIYIFFSLCHLRNKRLRL